MGTIKEIIYEENKSPPLLPLCLLIEFDDYKGPYIIQNLFPIIPLTRKWIYKGIECSRTQLPVTVAYAITIHKSQGQTLKKAVIDIGNSEKQLGQTYVALSRVRSINDMIFSRMYSKSRFDNIQNSSLYSPRQKFFETFANNL